MSTAPSLDVQLPGIARETVSRWLCGVEPSARRPLDFTLIAGGMSNLTYRVTDRDGAAWILRRPPLGELVPTAHDVAREYRAIAALQDTGVPVPRVVGFCADMSVTGAPFYVMSCVAGAALHSREAAERFLDEPARGRASESLIDTLIALQCVDIDRVGLGTLGRREHYLARQLKRFGRILELCNPADRGAMLSVHEELERLAPAQGPATIVHGDFRIGNCIVTPEGRIAAVLDWETATLGDPLIDISLMAALWTDFTLNGGEVATEAPGFWTVEKLLTVYAQRSGRDLGLIDYYLAFQNWRMSVICEEIVARQENGAYGAAQESTAMRAMAQRYARKARTTLDRFIATHPQTIGA